MLARVLGDDCEKHGPEVVQQLKEQHEPLVKVAELSDLVRRVANLSVFVYDI